MLRLSKMIVPTVGVFFAMVAFSAFAGGEAAAASCDVERGEKLFNKCLACHTYNKTKNHSAGPNLYGVVERPVGQVDGFKFSPALRKSGDTWTVEHLNAFLQHPMGVYSRTRMAFSGLKKANDRSDIICFMSENVVAKK